MRKEIKQLQNHAEKLELTASRRAGLTQEVVEYAEGFLQNLPSRKAYVKPEANSALPSFSEEPAKLSELLNQLKETVDSVGLNPASGGHLGYIPGGGLYASALADFIAAVTNRYAGVFYASPGAVHIENQCIRWLCDLIGYGDNAGGNLTSGGSLANLIGMVNARDDAGLKSQNFRKAVIYTTRQVHHCVIKAIKFAGLEDAQLRVIPMDDQFRMKPALLEKQIEEDLAKGLKPLVIFASAGTTDVGAVDPLEKIGKIAADKQVWFHVDAAYGGAFLLTDHGQTKMKGIRQADSVTIDPHKGFFLPYGSGALLVKDAAKLYESQHMSANYMQDTEKAKQPYSPADLSPELSKHFRGLRFWLPLKLFGIAPFRAALNEKLKLTRYFYKEVKKMDHVETGPSPELSVMFFRCVPPGRNADDFNRQLVEALHEDGRIFMSSTTIEGTFYIRLAVLSFRTHLETIDSTLAMLKSKIEKLT